MCLHLLNAFYFNFHLAVECKQNMQVIFPDLFLYKQQKKFYTFFFTFNLNTFLVKDYEDIWYILVNVHWCITNLYLGSKWGRIRFLFQTYAT